MKYRTLVVSVAVALLVGALVLLVGLTRGAEYQGRVSLLATPAAANGAPYGEVVSLALPALVELARSPSVLRAAAPMSGYSPDELAGHVSVELVPASGLARLSVRAASAEQAGATATALGKAMIDADLLAPAAKLRTLDPRPDVVAVAPDGPLVLGLALVGAVAAGLATAALRRLTPGSGPGPVRRALAGAGVRRPVTVLRADDPAVTDRLAVLCRAAGRPVRVLPVTPDLAETAAKLAAGLPEERGEGASVVAVAVGGRHQADLTAAAGVLPSDAVLVAVVLA
ncbi:hypothetical protein DMA12_13275 [Amycolatopsis balhimycina DSM 5908]|uniref:Capsular polysaccharide biosynthesis protein n=1 Tax=Amycolatopsis balhimycina DSM 5908 TaxID=1081091 RepID=A0A428WS00_AMYBA|nr:hypothetical protein [Amycolatopsis balhimycina]RSM45830.1 hypothetical protein DMA12_13275 [Amycolatopsis balhimycina DSM 5908]